MKGTVLGTISALIGFACLGRAVNYPEQEPNNTFPPNYLSSNPVFLPGDSLVGNMPLGDVDQHYLMLAPPGTAGIYRYTFDYTAAGQDTIFELFDSSTNGTIMARNDDYPGRSGESIGIFEHVNPTGEGWNAGVRMRMYAFTGQANTTRLTIFRTRLIPDNLSTLPTGVTTRTGINGLGGTGNWFEFSLAKESDFILDTIGSPANTDTELVLFNANTGQTISASDDINPSLNNFASSLSVRLPAGRYYAAVGRYRMAYNFNPATQQDRGWLLEGFGNYSDGNSTSGAFTLNLRVTPAEYSPSSANVIQGDVLTGDLASLISSDDNRFVALSDSFSLQTVFEFGAVAFQTAAGRMLIDVEAACERLGLTLSVDARRFTDNQWVNLYGQIGTGDDSMLTIDLTTSVNDYIGDTGELGLRVSWEPVNDEDPAMDGWSCLLDQVRWTLRP